MTRMGQMVTDFIWCSTLFERSLRPYSSPDRSGKDGTAVAYLIEQPLCRTCSTTEQKAITHCFCEGCERSSTGYAGAERSGVVVAPYHFLLPSYKSLYCSLLSLFYCFLHSILLYYYTACFNDNFTPPLTLLLSYNHYPATSLLFSVTPLNSTLIILPSFLNSLF